MEKARLHLHDILLRLHLFQGTPIYIFVLFILPFQQTVVIHRNKRSRRVESHVYNSPCRVRLLPKKKISHGFILFIQTRRNWVDLGEVDSAYK